MKWWLNEDPLDDDNEIEIKALFLAVVLMAIVYVVSFTLSGCSVLHDSDERNLEVDCSNCRVKYKMNLDIDNAHIKEHIK